jgi:hypothetical protein
MLLLGRNFSFMRLTNGKKCFFDTTPTFDIQQIVSSLSL